MSNTDNKSPDLEYQWEDGAWYDVTISLVNSCLHVHYKGFSNVHDEIWRPEKFSSGEEVRSRFRLASEQLQDDHCSQVKVGMCICASCTSDGYDNRFFNAVVQEIHHSDHHHSLDGEHIELCKCQFQVLWSAGPYANQRSCVSVENVCLLKAAVDYHSELASFVTLVDSRKRKRTDIKIISDAEVATSDSLSPYSEIIMTECDPEGSNSNRKTKEEKLKLPDLNLPVELNDMERSEGERKLLDLNSFPDELDDMKRNLGEPKLLDLNSFPDELDVLDT